MKQFDIMWAILPDPIGRRPVLLLTRSSGYAYLNKILIGAGGLVNERFQDRHNLFLLSHEQPLVEPQLRHL